MTPLDLSSETRNLMARKMLGFEVDGTVAINFIITNIRPLFDTLVRAGQVQQEYHGFYRSVDLVVNDRCYRITLLTPGNVIIDVLRLLSGMASSVTLLGLCGSLNPQYPVASIVMPQYVTGSNDPWQKQVLNPEAGTGLCVCQVDGLVQPRSLYQQLVEAGVDLVDMESLYLKQFLPDTPLKTLYVVSDMPLESPFYEDHPIDFPSEALLSSL